MDLSPAFGPEDWTAPAAVAETHVSVVTFLGDRAYKLLKPLDLGFLDHRTVEARREACHREVSLNRRLAPDVYLGVADVTDGRGTVLDHLVVMRRMPAERRLTRLLDSPEAVDAVRAVARAVAVFHSTARRAPEIDAAGSRDHLAALWRENLAVMAPYVGTVLDGAPHEGLVRDAHAYLAGRGELWEARTRAGLMRDGHGDLLADDIFICPDGPRILDCLAFADELRWGDVLLDVAFLGMDLEFRGHPELARHLLEAYRGFADEHHPASLWWHLAAYRAGVRAKVTCLRHAQGDPAAAAEARRLHALCARLAARARVRLVLVGGPPGSGKSTIASALAEDGDLVLLRSDEIRKDMAGLAHDAHAAAAPGEGLYRPDRVAEVYAEMIRRAGRLLAMGESVLLDASWSDGWEREAARQVAAAAHAGLAEIRCEVDAGVADARIADRLRRGGGSSDADVAVARAMRRDFSPWPEAVCVDTGGTVADAAGAAREALGG